MILPKRRRAGAPAAGNKRKPMKQTKINFAQEEWQRVMRAQLLKNPKMTDDELIEYFGRVNHGYFPTPTDLKRERRIINEERGVSPFTF